MDAPRDLGPRKRPALLAVDGEVPFGVAAQAVGPLRRRGVVAAAWVRSTAPWVAWGGGLGPLDGAALGPLEEAALRFPELDGRPGLGRMGVGGSPSPRALVLHHDHIAAALAANAQYLLSDLLIRDRIAGLTAVADELHSGYPTLLGP